MTKTPSVNPHSEIVAEVIRLLHQLTVGELDFVHHRLAERLKLLHRAQNLVTGSQFAPWDRVCFTDRQKRRYGYVTRINPQSISVKTDDGHNWRVSPTLLSKLAGPG